jgi:hypothetical protein
MTYRELRKALEDLTEDQLNCDVTVEAALSDECSPAELRTCGEDHDILDEDHPVIYVQW